VCLRVQVGVRILGCDWTPHVAAENQRRPDGHESEQGESERLVKRR